MQFGIQVDEDGSFTILDSSLSGGRTFLGLGAILAGSSKSFSELLSMAAEGDPSGVDIYARDLKSDASDDVYNILPDDATMFQFGKGSFQDVGESSTVQKKQ